ncbi:MAG: hypothetical protein HYU76_12230 [Betaproteobacteria bacterium]|nr:hypothetical protein [Betaproteobacteria bacterium]
MHAEVKDQPSATVWSRKYWASKGKVRLYVYRKRAAPPQRGDKQFVFVSGLAHNSTLGINRHKVWHAMQSFLATPENRALAS